MKGLRAQGAGHKENDAENKLFYRSFDLLERGKLNEETREVELSFSSEEPVERWFGSEVLLHGEKNVNLKRLRDVGSVIYSHQPWDMKNIIGPIKSVSLDSEKKRGRALIGFDEDDTGETAMKKVKSRSLRGVSFSYMINSGQRINEGEEWTDKDSGRTFKGPAIVATKWTPYEISLTPVPADATVGVGRELTRSLDGIEITNNQKEERKMDKEEIMAMIKGELEKREANSPQALSIEEIVKQVRSQMKTDNKPKLNISVEQLQDITARAAAVSDELFKTVTNDALAGKTEAELLRTINDAVITRPDAKDSKSHDDEHEDKKERGYKTLKDIPDDVFMRSLK